MMQGNMKSIPIVLIHGFGGGAHEFALIKSFLEKKEYEDFEHKVMQDVYNDKRDLEDYIFLMKMILDGPVMYFGDDK
jgi:pimeloyl-ACP methyl ester carboxylesterase